MSRPVGFTQASDVRFLFTMDRARDVKIEPRPNDDLFRIKLETEGIVAATRVMIARTRWTVADNANDRRRTGEALEASRERLKLSAWTRW